jgi:streptogramin lyase
MIRRFFGSLALVALLGLAACAGQSGLSTAPARNAGPLASNSPTLTFKIFTAGQTPGFPVGASARDIAPGPGGTMWFTDEGTPAIGRISSDGTFTEFTQGLPAGQCPMRLSRGRTEICGSRQSRGRDRANHPLRHDRRIQ